VGLSASQERSCLTKQSRVLGCFASSSRNLTRVTGETRLWNDITAVLFHLMRTHVTQLFSCRTPYSCLAPCPKVPISIPETDSFRVSLAILQSLYTPAESRFRCHDPLVGKSRLRKTFTHRICLLLPHNHLYYGRRKVCK
jgi:hypothetical protein